MVDIMDKTEKAIAEVSSLELHILTRRSSFNPIFHSVKISRHAEMVSFFNKKKQPYNHSKNNLDLLNCKFQNSRVLQKRKLPKYLASFPLAF
jgi:hypothetical protein